MAEGRLKPKNYAKKTKINIDIPSDVCEMFLCYSLCTYSDYIAPKNLNNLMKLLEIIDDSAYENDRYDDYQIICSVKYFLTQRIINGINSLPILIQSGLDELKEYEDVIDYLKDAKKELKHLEKDENLYIISEEEVLFVNKFVQQRLSYYNIFKAREALQPLFKQIDSVGVNLEQLSANYTAIIENAFSENMKVKRESEECKDDFQLLNKQNRDSQVDKIIDEYNKPNNRIKTGIKAFNKMLGGGFENGRFYLIAGLPKSFKSGTLLNICLWGIKYNKSFRLKNPDAKPAIFYLTQENSTRETINRIYVHLTGKNISHLTKKEAKKLLDKELAKYNVDLFIKYRPTKSISTLDFDNMITEIETENNCEVILAVQDYTKRIRSANPNPELRLELAQIADDFCSIAKRRNIPIISGCQMNRQAYLEAEKAKARGKKDIAKELNASQIGESVGLIENADMTILINRQEISDLSDTYLSFKLFTTRDEAPELEYFAQKFENGMKLQEDADLAESLSYENISSGISDNFDAEQARSKAKQRKKKNNIIEEEDEDDDSQPIFRKKKKATINPNKSKIAKRLVQLEDDNIEFDDE